MEFVSSIRNSRCRWSLRPAGMLAVAVLAIVLAPHAPARAQDAPDPRVGLRAGWTDAGEAARNLEILAHVRRPAGFFNPANPGDGAFSNTDLAFRGDLAFVGNYHGFTVYDVSDPANPRLRVSVVCPGGQGDVSVHGDLLFMSVEEMRGRVDCGTGGAPGTVNPDRFRGVRIFDISDLDRPRQVAAVQTCRGSHTHTLVAHPRDPANLYVYSSGSSVSRPGEELEGCSPQRDPDDPVTAYWSIGVIQVPLARPHEARLIGEPRVFADRQTGDIAGLWQGGDHGEGTQRTAQTNHCHDITAYPEIGLAAGACSGNGILFDISDPANPFRIHEVTDANFAYWHSATFNNDGSKVIFTDEWGGGRGARCRAEDPREWGANAIFEVVDRELRFAGYYKLPAPQTDTENCVAHNGSLIPVPGRDIKVQAWYQGGISVFDFTDASNPVEIAFFDRGPLSDTELMTGGYWSAYWHNGRIYGSEISRGLDVLRLVPSQHLSQNEIEAAEQVVFDEFNPQHQPRVVWPATFVVARAYLDQLDRSQGLARSRIAQVRRELERAERQAPGPRRSAALERQAARLEGEAVSSSDPARLRALAATLVEISQARP
jgi:hypothetical protein